VDNNINDREFSKLLEDRDRMLRLVRTAVRNAVLEHKRAGNPVAGWENGKVVIVPPEDIDLPEGESSTIRSKHTLTGK
jgi:uncharacterized sporulation protein YeaH/YhbH (DUF444 family)